ncbi:lysophospholipid acyltransferase family protein [Alistipes sp.]|uniref:lysophospholipid acyltransferase family protein n=1 Tax=Alistipes sp. TaxID=1872444 RepID=UPI003AEF8F66
MIPARHTFTGALIAQLYAGPLLQRAFREIRFRGEGTDRGEPILMLANHFCWWDGFIQYRLNRAFFRRKLYVMMLEEQLAKHPLLARCGCFSVRKNSRSLLETLDYCAQVLRSPDNMLLIFPQGAVESMHLPTPAFQAGAGRLFERIGGACDVVLNVNLTDYGAERKPRLDGYFRTLPGQELADAQALRREWERFYAACRERQCAL